MGFFSRLFGPTVPAAANAPPPPVSFGPACPVSPAAEALIVTSEISSEAYYEARCQNPTWPGGASGVTIGIGYDLGYATEEQFRVSWGNVLPAATLNALAPLCGIKGTAALRQMTAAVHAVHVPLTAARAVFDGDTLPHAVITTRHAFANFDLLPPDAGGALVSIVYNRGASMGVEGATLDARMEMRQIRDSMADKRFSAVPHYIRSMKRLWTNGLVQRREAEAVLFEKAFNA